jgi:hypothetical protein
LRIKGRIKSMEMLRAFKIPLPSENLFYAITAVQMGMSDPRAPFLKHKKQRSRKKCPNKQIMANDLWPSIRLHGIKVLTRLHGIRLLIKPHGIKTPGIKLQGTRCLGISGLNRDLSLPIIVANPSSTNPSIPKSRRRWKMIYTARNHRFGCKA